MSNYRFIKYIPSEETSYLRKKHPNAFLLLSLIAERARRTSGSPDGLEIGEAHIGDYEEAGIETRDKYRTALEVLENRKHIKKVETCRNRKKCPTGSTTIGTKVKLLDSGIWDINQECYTHQLPHRIPTGSPPDPHEQERIRKNKNEKEEQYIPSASPSEKVIGLDFVNEKFEQYSSNSNDSLISDAERNITYIIGLTKSNESETNSNKIESNQNKSKKIQNKPSELAISLVEFFYDSLAKNVPTYRNLPKTPQKLNTEALHFDEILKTYSESEIKRSINYGHANEFWKSIITEAKKLKAKIGTLFTQLELKNETSQRSFRKTERFIPTECRNATFKPNPRKFLDANTE